MEVSKVLLYCTKAKPYLLNRKDYPYDIPEKADFILRNEKQIKNDIIGDSDFVDGGDLAFERSEIVKSSLNGKVCFECDCKEAFDISKVVQTNKNLSLKIRHVYDTEEVTLFRGLKTALTLKQIEVYQGTSKRLFAIRLEKVEAIAPFLPTELYLDFDCTKPLKQAPQSYCFAYYRKMKCLGVHMDGSLDMYPSIKREKVLVFSIRSNWLCKIANGEKDLEVRKQRILNAGIEYK